MAHFCKQLNTAPPPPRARHHTCFAVSFDSSSQASESDKRRASNAATQQNNKQQHLLVYCIAQHKISPLGRALGSRGGKKCFTTFGVARCSDAQFCRRKRKISGDMKQVVLIWQASPIHHSYGLIVLQPGSSSLMEHRW